MKQYWFHALVVVGTVDVYLPVVLGWAWGMFRRGWLEHVVAPVDGIWSAGECGVPHMGHLVWAGASSYEGRSVGVQHSL